MSAPSFKNEAMNFAGSSTIKCTSRGRRVLGLNPVTTTGAHAQIRNEVPIHHINVNAVGARLLRFSDLLAQPTEIRG